MFITDPNPPNFTMLVNGPNIKIFIDNISTSLKCNADINKLVPYGTGGQLLLTANFKVM